MQAATLQVVFSTVIWGFAFVATKWAVMGLGPFWLTVWRFAAAILLALPLMLLHPRLRRSLTLPQLRLALLPGVLLAAMMLLQTAGLVFTTVTNSSFITTLYVVIVPLCAAAIFNQKVPRKHWWLVAMAILGTALICRWQRFVWNLGDFLTLLVATTAAMHMLVIERRITLVNSAFAFNLYQTFWAGLISLPFALAFEPLSMPIWSPQAAFGFFFLVVPCTLIAFGLQVKAQRVLPAVFISLLFLLESPVAALFGWFILGERLTLLQALGAALILISAILAVRHGRDSQA